MLEVNTRALDMYFDVGRLAGLSREDVLRAFELSEPLPDRLDWAPFAAGCDRVLERIGSAEVMEAAARSAFVESTGTVAQVRVLRLFASPRALYWSLHRFGGHSLFSNATTEIETLGPTRLRFRVRMRGQPSMGFWVTCAGIIAGAPTAIGYPPSVVRYEPHGEHCDYFIEHAQSWSILAKLRALWIALFSRGAVLDELEAQKRGLEGQFAELERANRRAEQALALRTRFLNTVTHEIRTPLSGIIGLSDILLDPTTSAAEVPEIVREIRRSGEHLLHVVNDVLVLDGAREVTPEPGPVALAPLFESLLRPYAFAAHARAVELSWTIAPTLPQSVSVDRNLLTRALRCLLDNAVAFTERGAVRVRVDGGEGRMRIEVIDTGVGIAPALQRKIFEPFTQVHDGLNRTHQGVGLGLAVARRIANALGGTIEVTSALGAGSTFTLSLVYEAVSAGEALVDAPVAAQVLTPLELPPHPAGAMETLDVPPLASVTPLTVRVTPRASVPAGPVANVTPLGPVTVTPVVPSASADPRPFEERRSAPPDRAADRGPGERSADSNPPRRSFPPPPPEPSGAHALPAGVRVSVPPGRRSGPPSEAAAARALIVEDNLVNQRVLRRILQKLGVEADIAENGEVAVERCATQSYDIIFMDIQMPVMDGFEATALIRRRHATPVIAVTANSEDEFRERAYAVGMNGFLGKPVSTELIADALSRASIASSTHAA
jgi:signal transduction histidine kinase/ActR/RegA family two-component response regulator